jgi:hypothetical protein
MRTRYLLCACAVLWLQSAATAQFWGQIASTGPTARYSHAMAYDSSRQHTVLFGGYDAFTYLSDTWAWNGSSWTQMATTGPVARGGHAMTYDSLRGRVVLFGGYDINGIFLGDTWEWDGNIWLQVATTGPAARGGHAVAYDSQRGRAVLFGGWTGTLYGDTWEWNGNSWTQVATGGPSARAQEAMAYDDQRGCTVLFGGWTGVVGNHYNSRETWEWNGNSWSQVSTNGPSARTGHAMIFDGRRGRTVLFGGDNFLGDTWEWNGNSWTQELGTTNPVARNLAAMAFDVQRGRTVLFGGYGTTGSFLGDTWERNAVIPSTAAIFGTGCGSPALAISPVATARPVINATAQASLTNIPSSLAFVALGWSRTMVGPFALPFPLAGYGMPGCYMLHSAEAAAQPVKFTGPTNATYSLPIPNWSVLIGLHLYLQGWAAAPGTNPGDTVVSNGLEWVVGNT